MLHSNYNIVVIGFPVFLLVIDYVIRLIDSFKTFSIKSATAVGDVTLLEIETPSGWEYEAGQFCQLMIKQVSQTQNHPFSISSAPSRTKKDNTITFHIKNMSDDPNKPQFTSTLHALAKENKLSLGSDKVVIQGPYGSLALPNGNFDKFKAVVLVAGGVGITPFASIFEDLKNTEHKLKNITLVWSNRGEEAFNSWFPALRDSCPPKDSVNMQALFYNTEKKDVELQKVEVKKNQAYDQFDALPSEETDPLKCRVEGLGDRPPSSNSSLIRVGRPSYQELIREARQHASGEFAPGDVAVLACGPEGLVAHVQALCGTESYYFHKETFLL